MAADTAGPLWFLSQPPSSPSQEYRENCILKNKQNPHNPLPPAHVLGKDRLKGLRPMRSFALCPLGGEGQKPLLIHTPLFPAAPHRTARLVPLAKGKAQGAQVSEERREEHLEYSSFDLLSASPHTSSLSNLSLDWPPERDGGAASPRWGTGLSRATTSWMMQPHHALLGVTGFPRGADDPGRGTDPALA